MDQQDFQDLACPIRFSNCLLLNCLVNSQIKVAVKRVVQEKGLPLSDQGIRKCTQYCAEYEYTDIAEGVDAFCGEMTAKFNALTPEAVISAIEIERGCTNACYLSEYLQPFVEPVSAWKIPRSRIGGVCRLLCITITNGEQEEQLRKVCKEALDILQQRIQARSKTFLQSGTIDEFMKALDTRFARDRLRRFIVQRDEDHPGFWGSGWVELCMELGIDFNEAINSPLFIG